MADSARVCRNLRRQTFGKLQAKLFPTYFVVQAGALAVQLATLAGMPSLTVPSKIWASLGASLLASAKLMLFC